MFYAITDTKAATVTIFSDFEDFAEKVEKLAELTDDALIDWADSAHIWGDLVNGTDSNADDIYNVYLRELERNPEGVISDLPFAVIPQQYEIEAIENKRQLFELVEDATEQGYYMDVYGYNYN